MLRTYNPLRSVTVWKFPEPPIARSQGKAAPVVLHRLDWRAVGLPENDGKVAFIIDNAFTPDECQNLLKAAEDSAPWTPAAVHGSPQKQIGKIREDYRKSSRILLDDFELADYILQKLKPYMPEEALTAPEGKLEHSVTVFRLPEPPAAPFPYKAPPVVVHQVDWKAVGFPENDGKVAFIIDNALTREDCEMLLKAGEDSGSWAPAAVHSGLGDKTGTVMEDYRKSSRILLDDFELADFILSKLKPHLPQEALTAPESKRWQFAAGARNAGGLRNPKDSKKKRRSSTSVSNSIELTRLNERPRYLKYVEGDFFESHCDGTYCTPDRSEVSCLTLQLYLNGSKGELQGGATQFQSNKNSKTVINVDPRPGRALIFEQGNLLHCGDTVLKGEKYTIRTDLMYKRASA
ncbi:hypothetical protein FRB90_003640 [Tulasnella sp. 427]|nr:hypothetical protein FRB90_003640 [Tulasnella sp. 427]